MIDSKNLLVVSTTYYVVSPIVINILTSGASGGGGCRPSEWYRAASHVAAARGAAPSAGKHWKGGAGCHTLPGGVGGLRDASCQPHTAIGSAQACTKLIGCFSIDINSVLSHGNQSSTFYSQQLIYI